MAVSAESNAASSPLCSQKMNFSQYKNSLYGVAERLCMLNKRCFLHRLVYVAKIKAGQAGMKDLAGYYEMLFAVYHNTNMEGVTGLLLLYPSCIIHVLESSSEVLYSVLNDLSNMEKRSDSLLQDAKILVMSHDIPMRMFQVWGYRFLNNITLTSQEAAEQKQPVENLVPECLPLLYKLCVHFLKSSKGVGDNFQEQFLIIEEDSILYLCISNVLHSPEQFLQTYNRPFSVVMDSEIVWPTQSHLYM